MFRARDHRGLDGDRQAGSDRRRTRHRAGAQRRTARGRLFDAQGMTARPAGEISRRPPLRQGDRGEAVFRSDQTIKRPYDRDRTRSFERRFGRTSRLTPNEGPQEKQDEAFVRQAGVGPSAFLGTAVVSVDIGVAIPGRSPQESQSRSADSTGHRSEASKPYCGRLSMVSALRQTGPGSGLGFRPPWQAQPAASSEDTQRRRVGDPL